MAVFKGRMKNEEFNICVHMQIHKYIYIYEFACVHVWLSLSPAPFSIFSFPFPVLFSSFSSVLLFLLSFCFSFKKIRHAVVTGSTSHEHEEVRNR